VAAWPKKADLLKQLAGSPVVGRPGEFKPLILDGQNRLYLQRYWQYEAELAATIVRLEGDTTKSEERAPHPDPLPIGSADAEREKHSPRHDVETHQLKVSLAAHFPSGGAEEMDWQMVAAVAALRRRLCIISGGPGTGKTRTVVVLLALLLEQNPALRIALAAPTGKAAARLQESVKNARATLPCAPAIQDLLPTEAGTIHRLLGTVPDSAYFRHDAANPLPFDVIVVDEASMVDLALMAKLVSAIPPSARLILLGDKDQLASVEAGAVLADLCNGASRRAYSPAFAKELKEMTGLILPADAVSGQAAGLADCIVELRRNYRFGEQSEIHRLSQAVNAGDAEAVVKSLREAGENSAAPVVWRQLPAPSQLKQFLKPLALSRFKEFLQSPDPAEALRAFARFRILCALRHGPYGVEQLNAVVEDILAEAGWIRPDGRFYAGRPVMIVRNDYNLKLFNGDIGVLRRNAAGELRAYFAGPDQALREVMPLRLPEHETAFALTVHKSQGSEFERVLLMLPREDSLVLSRELVYTGLTRASRAVALWSSLEILTAAVRRNIRRRSGLRDALWGEAG
jgi:exodeoxyribonuclease V alpha subunit